ncbi:hypothetical protein [Peribacillus simplex]|uniref:hypothetical protein n=1 Tax=Peribacillus simplex TaxID=1478 RepID=UPI003D2E4845
MRTMTDMFGISVDDDEAAARESSIRSWKWVMWNGYEDKLPYDNGYTRTNEVGKHDYNTGLLVEVEPLPHEAQLIWDNIDKSI